MARFKVVITDHGYVTDEHERSQLEPLDADLVILNATTEEEIITGARDADGILNRTAPMTRKVIEALEKCRVIARYGIGYDNVDVEAATEHGICVANVPDYCWTEVADHALALLLSCARKTVAHDKRIRTGEWDIGSRDPIYRLSGKTLGLLGLGNIAQTLVRRVRGFEFNVIAHDPYIDESISRALGVRLVDLDMLLSESDYLSVHAPLTPDTRHIIGESELRKMKKTAVLVNTSRGGLLDTHALAKALEEGWIAGAGIDVYEDEPPPATHPLFKQPNAVLTGHEAWYSEESVAELQTKTARQVALVLAGGWPENLVNPKVKDREPR